MLAHGNIKKYGLFVLFSCYFGYNIKPIYKKLISLHQILVLIYF